MHKRMMTILACPKCKNKLKYSPDARQAFCLNDNLVFPIRNGVPVLLESEAKHTDSNFNKAAQTQEQVPAEELTE